MTTTIQVTADESVLEELNYDQVWEAIRSYLSDTLNDFRTGTLEILERDYKDGYTPIDVYRVMISYANVQKIQTVTTFKKKCLFDFKMFCYQTGYRLKRPGVPTLILDET